MKLKQIVLLRREVLECYIKNKKIRAKDIAIALNIDIRVILSDVATMDNVWEKGGFLCYGGEYD